MNHSAEVFISREGYSSLKLSSHGEPLKNRRFGTYKVLQSQSTDGKVELDGMLMTPAAKAGPDGFPTEPLPTLVLIHGGPDDRDIEKFGHAYYWPEYLVSKGYGILFPQYRGSSARGKAFGMSNVEAFGVENYQDVVSITNDAVQRGYADPKRLMVGGWSGGGLLSFLGSVRNGMHGFGWRFQGAIVGAGVCDADTMIVTSDIGAGVIAEFNGGLAPWHVAKTDTRARQGSGLWEVKAAVDESKRTGEMVIPPMLILHGSSDSAVPHTQAVGIARALRAHGLHHEFVSYPGQGHSLSLRAYWIDSMQRVARWCDTYIGTDPRDI